MMSEPTALQRLLRAIVSRDRGMVSRLLAESPELARLAITVGATREAAEAYFFQEIAHYAYAGDTALHIAAAAYEREIAEELVARGANVSARNRRGAEPLHYAADGIPGSDAWQPDAQYAVVEFLVRAGADPNSVVQERRRAVASRGANALHRCRSSASRPAAAARPPRWRATNRRKSSGSFSIRVPARRIRASRANRSRILFKLNGSTNS
jgi:hypothetical protein